MIKALLHKKLKDSFSNPDFKPSEDSLTSSIIGLLQYLPDEKFWDLLQKSCGQSSNLLCKSGKLLSIEFWKKFNSDKRYNSNYVEPDVFCEFENFNLIIEAKKTDTWGQYALQWEKEITSYVKSQSIDDCKELIFIALGGNESLRHQIIKLDDKEYIIYLASWHRLLSEVEKYRNLLITANNFSNFEFRILSDVLLLFNRHNYFDFHWLERLKIWELNNESINLFEKWNFNDKSILSDFLDYSSNCKIDSNLNTMLLWKTH